MVPCGCINCALPRLTDRVIAQRVLLEDLRVMEIKRPIELAGLKSRLQRAQKQETRIADTGKRYDAVLDQIDDLTDAHVAHVGQLEHHAGDLRSAIERMVGSNGDPNGEDGHDGQSSGSEGGQIISSETTK